MNTNIDLVAYIFPIRTIHNVVNFVRNLLIFQLNGVHLEILTRSPACKSSQIVSIELAKIFRLQLFLRDSLVSIIVLDPIRIWVINDVFNICVFLE